MSDLSSKVSDEKMKEFLEKVPECSKQNHPHPGRIVVGYQPGRKVMVQCTNCNGFYERSPTADERESYSNLLKMEINV